MSLIKTLIRHEGFREHPYHCSADKLTIAIGRNLDDVGISYEEALYLLKNDIKRVREELDRSVPWYKQMDQDRQDVFINMVFNLGISRFLGFKKMLAAAKEGDYQKAADEMLDSRWANQVGNRATELAQIMRDS